ncbi:CBS domain-containing protein [Candidatus Woesebacteria bacterium]|nr:CBS domain-containing protein [Candidatus Woesebacteria bacterium]
MLISELYHKHVITISQEATIFESLRILIEKKVNGLVVLDNDKKVVGILALQDIAAATIPRQFRHNIQMAAAMYRPGFFSENCAELQNKKVSTIMRKKFTITNLNDNIMAVAADFLKNDLYIVPVIEQGELLGVITRSEIKKALAYGMKMPKYYNEMKDSVDKPNKA